MRNLVLTSILASLLVFTYFYQELGTKLNQEESDRKTTLISTEEMGRLLSVNGPHFAFKRIENGQFQFINKDSLSYKVDQMKLEKFFEALASLRIERELNETDIDGIKIDHFVPREGSSIRFNFSKDFIEFKLGNKIETDQTFYVSFKTKNSERLLIVKDTSALLGTYLKEDFHRNNEKYRKIGSLFVLTDEFFWDLKLLNEKIADWKSIEVLNVRKKSFAINVQTRSTQPAKFASINYNQSAFDEFFNSIKNLNSKKISYFKNSNELKDFVSQIAITKLDGSQVYLSLYQGLREEKGYFVVVNDHEKVYELETRAAKVFFANIQDFWNKKPIELSHVKNFEFGKENNLYQLKRSEGDSIKYEVLQNTNLKAHHRNIEKLLDYFNQESDRVSLFDKFDQELYPEHLFEITLNSQKFKVIKSEVELLLVDIQNQIKYHFYTGQEIPFSGYLDEYILKAK